jgi:hypothetical protein
MAELYFPDASGWARYREQIKPDGMQHRINTWEVFYSGTEMVGIA